MLPLWQTLPFPALQALRLPAYPSCSPCPRSGDCSKALGPGLGHNYACSWE